MNASQHHNSDHWQSGFLSYATAQLITEFPSLDPMKVLEAVKTAVDQVPVRAGGHVLLGKAREVVRELERRPA